MKKRMLVWADSPTCATGFATVSRNILKSLVDEYDIDIVGINYNGWPYDREKYPYVIYPAALALSSDRRYQDVYGRQLFVDMASTGNYDTVFMIQDTFIVRTVMPALLQTQENMPKDKKFTTVFYFPIDATPKKEWVTEVVAKIDFPVAYTQYAKTECEKFDPNLYKMPIIYHGVDKNIFHPLENRKELKKEMFGKYGDNFLILNVSRNQPRKDLHKTFAAFSLLKKERKNVFLFILAQNEDVGGNLETIAEQYGLKRDVDWACPPDDAYGANQGWPIEVVNKLYNVADVVISTAQGEGYGLCTVEGMACKTPLLMPKNTALVEIIGENEERGYFCKSGASLNDFICMGGNDNNILRPTTDAYDMKNQLIYIMDNPDEAKTKAEIAYDWAQTWEKLCERWKEVFQKAVQKTEKIRS